MPSLLRKSWGRAPGRSSGNFGVPREPGGGEAWVTRVHGDDPRMQTGIRYYPETDTFVMPPGRGRGGSYVSSREIPGKEFLERYPGGDAANLRSRRLDELRTTGRLEGRATDRYGNPWPADRNHETRQGGSHHSGQSRHGSGHQFVEHGRTGGTRSRSDAYSVELPDIPEESDAERAPLLLAEHPHWGGSSRHSSRMSNRHSSRAPSRRSSRR